MPNSKLTPPRPKEILYSDKWLYVCLARFSITAGHTVVVWKKHISDLHDLTESEYDYLMEIVDTTRDTLLDYFDVEKVYLVYMDEIRQVHWHLVPRYNKKGFNIFLHSPKKTSDFRIVPGLRKTFIKKLRRRKLRTPK